MRPTPTCARCIPKHEQFERLRQLLLKLRGARGELRADEEGNLYGGKLQSAVPQLQRANSWEPDVKIESARAEVSNSAEVR